MAIGYIPPSSGSGGGGGFSGSHNDLDGRSVPGAHPASAITGLADVAHTNNFSSLSNIPSAFNPTTHAARHGAGGGDPIVISTAQVTGLLGLLGAKADLIDGKVPTSQLPSVELADVFPVADSTERLALSDVDPGDIAIQADDSSVWILTATPASESGNWLSISVSASVISVNGQTGVILLSHSDVGAAAEEHEHTVEDITDFPTDIAPAEHATAHLPGGTDELEGLLPGAVHVTPDATEPDADEGDWWFFPAEEDPGGSEPGEPTAFSGVVILEPGETFDDIPPETAQGALILYQEV